MYAALSLEVWLKNYVRHEGPCRGDYWQKTRYARPSIGWFYLTHLRWDLQRGWWLDSHIWQLFSIRWSDFLTVHFSWNQYSKYTTSFGVCTSTRDSRLDEAETLDNCGTAAVCCHKTPDCYHLAVWCQCKWSIPTLQGAMNLSIIDRSLKTQTTHFVQRGGSRGVEESCTYYSLY